MPQGERMGNKLDPIVYGLLDPRAERLGELRYIGKSKYGLVRARQPHDAYCGKWQRHLASLGLKPQIVVLYQGTVLDDEHLYAAEAVLIAAYREAGADLTNVTDGGEGSRGAIPSEETRRKMSASRVGKKRPPRSAETLRRMAEAQRGKRHSEAARQHMADAHRGSKRTPEQCARIAAANTGKRHSEEARTKIGAASRGRRHTDATKALLAAQSAQRRHSVEEQQKMSVAMVGRVFSPEHRAKIAASARARFARTAPESCCQTSDVEE